MKSGDTIKNILITLVVLLLLIQLFFTFLPYPELTRFRENPYSLHILDRNGTLLQVLALGNGLRREFIPLKDVPPIILRVFISAEDANFFTHRGYNPVALFRAWEQNLRHGEIVSGASTITMQLARIISPHKGGYAGKIEEIFHALLIEARMNKTDILELWLNSIPFGFNTVGIASASKVFFGEPLQSLLPADCILLALIPRNPAKYNPLQGGREIVQAGLALARRIGIPLSAAEIEQALERAKNFAGKYHWPFFAPHFVHYVTEHLSPAELAAGRPVYTSLDLELNRRVEAAIKTKIAAAYSNRIQNGAALLLDNRTGEILAYVGSQDYFDPEYSGQIDGIQIRNQPGSTLKPYLYALALTKGFTAASVLPDIPTDFGGEEVYIPLNFNERFNGPVRLRVALASSLNVPAVYLLERLGVKNFSDKLIELGFNSLKDQASSVGIGLALGNAEVSLYELVRAFSVFPRDGKLLPTTWRRRSREGKTDFIDGKQVFDPLSAGIIRDILSDEESRIPGFGPDSILNTPFPAIFKTGTSNQFNNIWAVGATPRYTMGVWMGNFSGHTVIGAPGSSLPAQVVIQVLSPLSVPGENFPKIANAQRIHICTLSGGKATPLCPATTMEYFPPGTEPAPCTYHVEVNGRVIINYPPEYQLWAMESGHVYDIRRTTGTSGDSTSGKVRIIHPAPDAVFFYDPAIPAGEQAVRIEVISQDPSSSVELSVDGVPVAQGFSPLACTIPLVPGEHRVLAQGKNGYDELHFEVR